MSVFAAAIKLEFPRLDVGVIVCIDACLRSKLMGEIANGGGPSARVVESFDEVEDGEARLLETGEAEPAHAHRGVRLARAGNTAGQSP